MGKQDESTFLVNKADDEALLPCGCGDTEDHIVFSFEKDKEWQYHTFFHINLGGTAHLGYRFKNAWRYFWTGQTYAGMHLNQETVKDFSNWLNKKLAEAEKM